MRGSRKFCQRGSTTLTRFFFFFFSLIRGGRIQIPLLVGHQRPPVKRHLNGVSLVGWWWPNIECWIGSFVILRGSGPVLLRNPIFFVIFQGGGLDPLPPPPPLYPHMEKYTLFCKKQYFAFSDQLIYFLDGHRIPCSFDRVHMKSAWTSMYYYFMIYFLVWYWIWCSLVRVLKGIFWEDAQTGWQCKYKIKGGGRAWSTVNQHNMSHVVTKPVFGFPTKLDSNQSPQLQRLARKLEFCL